MGSYLTYKKIYSMGILRIWGRVISIMLVILIYLLTAIELTPGGSSTVHIYTKNT